MGQITEVNWLLKLNNSNGLNEETIETGETFKFNKSGYRIYPINIPIDLLNSDWEVIAKIVIVTISIDENTTFGEYKVIRLYSNQEKLFLTNYWRENIQIIKNKTISSFKNIKIT